MPQWIHDRAKHIQAKNPSMPESEAWAIATQQSHATGHSPKGYGTSEGRHEAHEKYPTPGDDEQKANPKSKTAGITVPFSSALVGGFCDELRGIIEKRANLAYKAGRIVGGAALGAGAGAVGGGLRTYMHGGDKEQIGKSMRRHAVVGAIGGGLAGHLTDGVGGGFPKSPVRYAADQMRGRMFKHAGLLPAPEQALTQMKPGSPKPTAGTKKNITAYSQPKTLPTMSPSAGAQPTAGAPPVRT